MGKETSDSEGINEKSSIVHMVDFGLAKPFIDADTGRHIPYSENRSICGTLRYISLNVHKVGIYKNQYVTLNSCFQISFHFITSSKISFVPYF